MRRFICCASIASIVVAACLPAPAATISYLALNTDADTGISTANQSTYTHLLDFGSNTVATINGVTFTKAGTSGAGFTYAVNSGGAAVHAGNTNTGVLNPTTTGAGLNALLTDMIYDGNNTVGGTETLTLTGLTAGQQYDTRVYARQWGVSSRIVNVTFNGDGTNLSTGNINEDDATQTPAGFATATQPYAISYKFTATGSSETVTFTLLNSNESWHVYGVTNQAVPEPAPVSVLLLGGAGLLMARRRRLV